MNSTAKQHSTQQNGGNPEAGFNRGVRCKIPPTTSQMKAQEMLTKLKTLDKEANRLRCKLRFAEPNKLLYRSFTSAQETRMVVVEADGHGGAWTSMVEGRFPLDYLVLYEKHFEGEAEAVRLAQDVVQLRADPGVALQPAAVSFPSANRCAKAPAPDV